MSHDQLLTREEAIQGLSGKRARWLLFLIEQAAAQAARDRGTGIVAPGPEGATLPAAVHARATAGEGAGAGAAEVWSDLEVLAASRAGGIRPSIRDLERAASVWASLVPENPAFRAVLAGLLGEKYRFTRANVPGIRAALGLDGDSVQQAYLRLRGTSLESIYEPRLTAIERLRWLLTRFGKFVDALPPFWLAFAFTLTDTVGASILALPIALARVGPAAGVLLLVLLGAVNLLTVAALAEATARSAVMRQGGTFIGRLVLDYLGPVASTAVTLWLAVISFLILCALYMGFSSALTGSTRVPPAVWTALLFAAGIFFLSRGSLSSTFASAVLVGIVNITLLVALSGVALAHRSVPAPGGGLLTASFRLSFTPAMLNLVFGVVLIAYFGHLSIVNGGRVVLRRDPGGRALIWGCASAQAAAIALYCLFLIGCSAALPGSQLVGQRGTVLEPLAAVAGPAVRVLGTIYVMLGVGMASIHFSFALFNVVKERLPASTRLWVVELGPGESIVLEPRPAARQPARVGVTYLGCAGRQPRLRVTVIAGGESRTHEVTPRGRWSLAAALGEIPIPARRGLEAGLDVLEADEARARILVETAMLAQGAGGQAGLSIARLPELARRQRDLLRWLMLEGEVSLASAAAALQAPPAESERLLDDLVAAGFARRAGTGDETRYAPRLGRRRGRELPAAIWEALGVADTGTPAEPPPLELPAAGGSRKRFEMSERTRFLVAVTPIAAVFAFTEWLWVMGSGSFSGVLNAAGVLIVPVLAGVFPVLLVLAGRRKGELAARGIWPLLGNPVVGMLLYLVYLSSLLLYGLVIWTAALPRALALLTALAAVSLTILVMRRGGFARRAVVELRAEPGDAPRGWFRIWMAGRPLAAEGRLRLEDGERQWTGSEGEIDSLAALQAVVFRLPVAGARELRVWAHRAEPDGDSSALPCVAEMNDGNGETRVDLALTGGQILLPLRGAAGTVELTLRMQSRPAGNEDAAGADPDR
jgi:amino acid permease